MSSFRRFVAAGSILLVISAVTPAQAFTHVPNLVYGTYVAGGSTVNLVLDLYLPTAGPPLRPVIVWIHGGGWVAGSHFPVPGNVTAFCASGYAVASVSYRLAGTAIWPAQINDCRGAIRWLRANAPVYGLDPDRFAAWGSSAGGHLAAVVGTSGGASAVTIGSTTVDLEGSVGGNLAFSSRVQAVVDWYGPTDFLAMRDFPGLIAHDTPASPESNLIGAAIQTVPALTATANPITYLTPDDPPMLIMHGTVDPVVPFNQSELLHAAAVRVAGISSKLIPIEGAAHGGPGFTAPEAIAAVSAHLDAALLNAPATRVDVSATDPLASEAGLDPGEFTITRTGSLAAPLTVRLALGGTAEVAADYAAPPLLAVIPAGAWSVAVGINPLGDSFVESGETVVLAIAPGAGYRIDASAQRATVFLADDETAAGLQAVSVSASDPGSGEGIVGTGAFTFSRTGPPPVNPLSVHYRLSGTALNGADYGPLSGTITIPAFSSSANLIVAPSNDTAIEPSETIVVTLSAAATYALGASRTAHVNVFDDDLNGSLPTVTVLVTDATATESGPESGTFTISRTGATAQPLLVPIVFSGAAMSGGDVAPLPAFVVIPVGASSAFVTVTPVGDVLVEGEEDVVLTISAAPQYQLASARRQELWIQDDDVLAAPSYGLDLAVSPLHLGTTVIASVAGGPPGQLFGLGAAPGPGYLDVPSFGQVLIDAATAVVAGGGTLDGAGLGGFTAVLPPNVSLFGFRVWLQAYAYDQATGAGSLSPVAVREIFQR